MRLPRLVMTAFLLPALSACTAGSATPRPIGPSYTCCEAADVNRDYRPGETLTIHWIVLAGQSGTGTASTEVELTVRLTGPYATVTDLKASSSGMGVAGASTFVAAPIRPSGQAGEQPVSVIEIPPTAEPGYYNLIHSVDQPGGSASGASIIRVTASA